MSEKNNKQYFNVERFWNSNTLKEKTEELLKPLDMPMGDLSNLPLPPLKIRCINELSKLKGQVLLEPSRLCIFSPTYTEEARKSNY